MSRERLGFVPGPRRIHLASRRLGRYFDRWNYTRRWKRHVCVDCSSPALWSTASAEIERITVGKNSAHHAATLSIFSGVCPNHGELEEDPTDSGRDNSLGDWLVLGQIIIATLVIVGLLRSWMFLCPFPSSRPAVFFGRCQS